MKNHHKTLKAITLVETLVYLALFAIFFTAVIQVSLNIQEGNANANKVAFLQRSKIFTDEHLNQTFSSAIEIDTTATVFDSTPGTLRLNTESGYVEYTLDGNRLKITDGTVDNFISPEYLEINTFQISRIDYTSGLAVAAHIQITFSDPKNPTLTETIDKVYSIK